MSHYFLAVSIPEELQLVFKNWQKELKEYVAYRRWTAPEDLHLTLAFLGEASIMQIEALISNLQNTELSLSFFLTLEGMDTFGQANRPRVLYAAVKPNQLLNELHETVRGVVEKTGFKVESRPFHPHITLAKKWDGQKIIADDVLSRLKKQFLARQQFQVQTITLFQIHPNRTPSYEALAVFPLTK